MDPILAKRLKQGESDGVAFLASAGERKTIARVVCSMLNSPRGGALYIGVDESGAANGLKVTPTQLKKLEQQLQTDIAPPALYSVARDEGQGGDIISIDVPPGSDRPYVIAGAIWVRSGAETVPAAPNDIRAMFDNQREPQRWERRLSTGMEHGDLDAKLVSQTRETALEFGRIPEDYMKSDEGFMRELSYARPSGYTNAADVLFSRNPQKRHPQTRVQLIEYRTDKVDDEYARYEQFEGPALVIVDNLYQVLRAHNRTRAHFERGSIERIEQTAYDDFTLREGVVNALAHRDYENYSGGVKISIYRDRIEYWNSGKLPPDIKISDLSRKHQSYPVNPDIAHAFYLSRRMDRIGRGTERIAEACRKLGARAPIWNVDHGGVTLTVFAATGDASAQFKPNPRQAAYLAAVAAGVAVSMADYQTRFAPDVDRRQASRDLNELIKAGLVEKEGAAKATVYRRTNR